MGRIVIETSTLAGSGPGYSTNLQPVNINDPGAGPGSEGELRRRLKPLRAEVVMPPVVEGEPEAPPP